MSNEFDPHTIDTADTTQEAPVPAQPQNELSDDELAKVSGGAIIAPGAPVNIIEIDV